jgi:NAD(P)-dependent dehydrogenase (short-subunit alcohol dehydrogenase family)
VAHDFGLTGRTALVTGASRGIGRAIAVGYAEAGADVAILARGTSALEEVADEVEKHDRQAIVLTCDVRDPEQVDAAVAAALTAFGHLDVVVNNAGGFDWVGPFLDLTTDDWAHVLQSNLDSVVCVLRAAGPHLVARGSGAVVNVSSVAGLSGVPMMAPYAVSKAAVISLSRTLAAEWAGFGVRVNAIAPGWVDTQLTRVMVGDATASDGLLRAVPARRWGTPEEVVGAAVYLASDAARLVTGAVLTVDGGMTAMEGGPTMLDLLALGRMPA